MSVYVTPYPVPRKARAEMSILELCAHLARILVWSLRHRGWKKMLAPHDE